VDFVDFVDKAIVFMIRGSRKKFNEPIAFYLKMVPWIVPICQIKLKNIINVVQSTGLTVVSTIRDQNPTNVNAINKLYKKTNEKYNKKDTENRAFGFEIETQKIIPLYDVPHLLRKTKIPP